MASVDGSRIHAAVANLVEAPPTLRFGPDRIAWEEDQESVRRLGPELVEAVFGDPALQGLGRALIDDPPARLRIESDRPEVLGLPWELAAGDAEPGSPVLAERCEIVRVPIGGAGGASLPPRPGPGPVLRVAVLSPRPRGTGELPLHPALGPILATALSSPDGVQLKAIRPPTLAALRREIADSGPFDVVHFDGHGRDGVSTGEILFEDDAGNASPVSPEEFAATLAVVPPRLILLNACRSASTGAGPEPVPSFAAELCLRLPSIRVIAMRYAVSVDFVEALCSSLYPQMAGGRDVGSAITATTARLVRHWRDAGSAGAPLFVNLTTWMSPSFEEERGRPREGPAEPPIDWRQAAPALFWAEEIELLHKALERERQILVVGTLGSSTPEVIEQVASYAVASGTFRRVVTGLEEDAWEAAEGTLHIVWVDPGTPPDPAIAAVEKLIAARPRSAAIVVAVDGRRLAGALRVGDGSIPPGLIAARLESLFGDLSADDFKAAQAWQLVVDCQDDFESVRELAAAADLDEAVALHGRLRWSNDLTGFALADRFRQALASLPEEVARLVSILGLSGGGLIYREMLTMATTAPTSEESFTQALGRQIEGVEWDAALDAAAKAGLIHLVHGLAPSPAARLSARQALGLRECLAAWAGEESVRVLQSAFARCAIFFSAGYDQFFLRGPAAIYSSFVASGDGLLGRATEVGLRERDDELAARALCQLLDRPTSDPEAALYAIQALATIYAPVEMPEFRSSLSAWIADHANSRERWEEALTSAESALAVPGAKWKTISKSDVQTIRSRALWRMEKTAAAETSLAEAARSAQSREEKGTVASASADFAQYLHLDGDGTEQLRRRIGALPESLSSHRRAIVAEADGRYGDALGFWLDNLRSAKAGGSAAEIARSLGEVGRLCAFHGDHDDAVYWLRRRLTAGVRLGMDAEQPLRYLGASAERAGLFAEATSWLSDALVAARAGGDERAETECLYEMGLVAMQVDEEGTGKGRDELNRAREIFGRLGPPLHVGDCWMALAQLEGRAEDLPAARAAADLMISCFREEGADGERLEIAEKLIAEIHDGSR
jgi:CHAT domain